MGGVDACLCGDAGHEELADGVNGSLCRADKVWVMETHCRTVQRRRRRVVAGPRVCMGLVCVGDAGLGGGRLPEVGRLERHLGVPDVDEACNPRDGLGSTTALGDDDAVS